MNNLTIATFTGTGFAIQESVLHMNHPLVRRRVNNGGGWRHRPIDLANKRLMLALGMLVWDGDETYQVNPEFDIAGAVAALTGRPVGAKAPRRGREGEQAEGSSPPPPVPPVPPPPVPPVPPTTGVSVTKS